jgi:DNA-binding GntR family transcriptional regulator
MTRAADLLIEQLKQEIADGVLAPGDSLEESTLSDRFGVSRTPIREALRSLMDSGLLEARSRKGVVVRVLDVKELMELFEVAAELEGMACRLAASHLTEENAQAIEAGLEACRDAAGNNDKESYITANLYFHQTIHDACDNRWLVDQLNQISLRINPYRLMPYELRGRVAQSAKEHEEIADAIFAGNGKLACDLMRDHMMLQGKRLPSLLKAL